MTDNHLPQGPAPQVPDVAERNVERLLEKAYRPEAPDPAFLRRVRDRLASEAAARVPQRRHLPILRHLLCPLAAAAAVAALAFGSHLLTRPAPQGPPPVVQNDNKDDKTPPSQPAPDHPQPPAPPRADGAAAQHAPAVLTPRERPAAPPPAKLAVGESLRTDPGVRKRVVLPDGSVLYLNQKTEIKLDAERRITLSSGEVFVEVAPRSADEGDPARFVVRTPEREVVALGTRFEVTASDKGTGVRVTQGKVRVSGLDGVLNAGEEIAPGGRQPTAAPRAAAALAWTRELLCTAEAPLVPPSKFADGALVVNDPSGQPAELSLRKYHVDVHVEDGFARTTIDQTYFNHTQRRLEGTFHFPLPPDASLSRLAMYVNGQLMEGGMAERDFARQTFENIVRRMQDPALLEWVDGTTFKMRVFPLEPRQEKRIILSYVQRLPAQYGRTSYRFPAGHSLEAVRDWSFHARIKGGKGLTWASDTHPELLAATTENDDLLLNAKQNNVKLDGDVALDLFDGGNAPLTPNPSPPKRGEGGIGRARFASVDHDGGRYLLVRYRPELPVKKDRPHRDWVFLFESSGDRDPLLARVQVEVVRALLANAEYDDTFAIVTAATRAGAFANEAKPAAPANVAAAVQFLEGTHLAGALDLGKALAAVEPFLKAAKEPYLVHVGSGYSVLGETKADVLARRVPAGVRYVGVGVGKRWNRALMKAAAERGGGFFTQINPDEPVNWRSFELYSALTVPRLLGVKVVDNAEKAAFLSHTSAVAQGEEVCAVTRLEAGAALPEAVTITGTLDGKTFQRTLPVKDVAAGAGYLPRTWAKLEIDRLLAENAQANKPRIVQLSMASYVMTPYTSLLVLENEQMYAQYHVDRGRKDHWAMYPCPENIPVVYEPLDGMAAAPKMTPAIKRSAEDVLGTILVRIPPRLFGNGAALPPAMTVRELHAGAFAVAASDVFDAGMEKEGKDSADESRPGEFPNAETEKRTGGAGTGSGGSGGGRGTKDPTLEVKVDPKKTSMPLPPPVEPGGEKTLTQRVGGPYQGVGLPGGPLAGGPPPGMMPPGGGIAGGMMGMPGMMGMGGMGGNMMGMNGIDWVNFYRNHGYQINTGMPGFPGPQTASTYTGRINYAPVFTTPGMQWALPNTVLAGPPLPTANAGSAALPSTATDSVATAPPANRLPIGGSETRSVLPFSPYHLPLTLAGSASQDPFRVVRPKVTWRPQRAMEEANWEREDWQRTIPTAPAQWAHRTILDEANWERADWRTIPTTPAQRAAMEAAAAGLTPANLPGSLRRERLLYRRPTFVPDGRLFTDLIAFAPGLNTSHADILGVLEAEAAPDPDDAPGIVEPAARALIEGARAAGWRTLTFPASGGTPGWSIAFDGSGRYAVERVLSSGLKEHVICDGKELLHLYPELGLGAHRTVTRFHRTEFADLVPWALPPAKDLAHGCDVKCAGERTVALLPHGIKADQRAVVVHLLFAANGRLAERRLVETPKDRTLRRETYGEDGVVKVLDAEGKVLSERKLTLKAGGAPDLEADTKDLVVLPMPLRTYEHLIAQPAANGGNLDTMDRGLRLSLLATHAATGNAPALGQILPNYFLLQGDHRQGFFTLLLSAGYDVHAFPCMEILGPPQKSPLACYIAWLGRGEKLRVAARPRLFLRLGDGLLHRLVAVQVLLHDWQQEAPLTEEVCTRMVQYIRESKSPAFAWAVVQEVLTNPDKKVIAEGGRARVQRDVLQAAVEALREVPGLSYAARYELALHLAEHGERDRARQQLIALYQETAKDGTLPALDRRFRQALKPDGDEPDLFARLMRETASGLVKDGRRVAAVALAWQCWDLEAPALADELLAKALDGIPDRVRRLTPTLAALEYLWQTHQYDRADRRLQELLKDETLARSAALWRMAYHLALQRKQPAPGFTCLAEALELEYRAGREWIDVEVVRRDYGSLLSHYAAVVRATATLGQKPPDDLAAKVVRAADRWRALDPDGAAACTPAFDSLRLLGEQDLAWDYLLMAMRPDAEGFSWANVAQSLVAQEDYDLAERAFAQACLADPANAPLLRARADNLLRAGRSAEARDLIRGIKDLPTPAPAQPGSP
jgi:hypothetical protein